MSPSALPLPADEKLRLDECVQELIRTPGAIQPHGALLAVDAGSLDIVYAGENSGLLLGREASDLLGESLESLVGSDVVRSVRGVLATGNPAENPIPVNLHGLPFDGIVHRSAALAIVEFEPAVAAEDTVSVAAVFAAIPRLATAKTREQLWAATASEVHDITQFDQVMVYHFHADGHGETVGEYLSDGMESYLGLHFPASDIPAQARRLYLTKLSRVIVTSDYENAALLSRHGRLGSADGAVVDLSRAELRSVSPHHVQFMRNMGQRCTFSLSLIHDGELIGMITCAHRGPRRIPYLLRRALEVLAGHVALQLSSMADIQRLSRQVEVRSVRAHLVGQMAGHDDIAAAMLTGDVTALDLVPAAGVTIRLDGIYSSLGETPAKAQLAALVEGLRGGPLVTAALAQQHPELGVLMPSVAGLILIPFGAEGDFIAWFRPEFIHTVNWLGDQTPANRLTPLSPRNSFSTWSQSVTGTSVPWNGLESEAAELCRDLDSALLRRAESTLARMAIHDQLTGLPNRRLLLDRVEHALTKLSRGEGIALLFIDLDGFKNINDSRGHEAGDAVLVHAAGRIVASTRKHDTVARLGGDEFVVLCENTAAAGAELVARRIVEALRHPITVAGIDEHITASIGIATAKPRQNAAGLIGDADAAMYRAKHAGKDRSSW